MISIEYFNSELQISKKAEYATQCVKSYAVYKKTMSDIQD